MSSTSTEPQSPVRPPLPPPPRPAHQVPRHKLVQEYTARSQWKTIMPEAGELDTLVRTVLLPSLEAWAARDGFRLRSPEMQCSAGKKCASESSRLSSPHLGADRSCATDSVRVGVSDLKPIDSNPPPKGWTRDTAPNSESKYTRSFRFREDTRVTLYSPEDVAYEQDDSDGEGLFD